MEHLRSNAQFWVRWLTTVHYVRSRAFVIDAVATFPWDHLASALDPQDDGDIASASPVVPAKRHGWDGAERNDGGAKASPVPGHMDPGFGAASLLASGCGELLRPSRFGPHAEAAPPLPASTNCTRTTRRR